ncbi:MAG: hypothetical protein WC488_03620 [Candidatus Micrarchaeia archaeon]
MFTKRTKLVKNEKGEQPTIEKPKFWKKMVGPEGIRRAFRWRRGKCENEDDSIQIKDIKEDYEKLNAMKEQLKILKAQFSKTESGQKDIETLEQAIAQQKQLCEVEETILKARITVESYLEFLNKYTPEKLKRISERHNMKADYYDKGAKFAREGKLLRAYLEVFKGKTVGMRMFIADALETMANLLKLIWTRMTGTKSEKSDPS